MNSHRKSKPTGGWATLALCGLGLVGGVAGAAPAVGPAWTVRYDAPHKMNAAADILVDAAGNSYTVMNNLATGGIQVVKHNKSGQRVWADGIDEGGMLSSITAALDKSGNVYVSSSHEDLDSNQSIWVTKFSGNGQSLWDVHYDGPNAGYAFAGGIAVDSAGDVYITGEAESLTTVAGDAVVVKLDKDDGEIVWEARLPAEENTLRYGTAIVVDGEGGVYVTGGSSDNGIGDFLTFKLNAANGAELWTSHFDGPVSGHDTAIAIALAGTGVVVTGPSEGAEGSDYQTIRYNRSDGEQAWASRYDGPAAGEGSSDEPTALAVDAAGNVYVTGHSAGTGDAVRDYATVKYNGATGAQAWAARYDGPGEEEDVEFGFDRAAGVAVDAAGNVYVTGDAINSDFQSDIATLKYNSSGQQQWVHLFNYRFLDDRGVGVGLDGTGSVYVAGTYLIDELAEEQGAVVLKYVSTGRGAPAPRIPKPTFTFSESAKDKLACFREEGETFCDEVTSSTFKVTSTATMQDVDITQFDETTTFSLSVGNLAIERFLGEDPRYTPGKTSATFVETVFDEDDRERKALTVTVSWPRGKLKVSVTSTAFFEGGILAADYLDQETGSIADEMTAELALGDFTQEFNVAVKGRVTSRPTRDEEFTISTVTINGKGAPL